LLDEVGLILESKRVSLPLPSLDQSPESPGRIFLPEKVGKISQVSIVCSPGMGTEGSQVRCPELVEAIQ
jgi:hypothetical protein